MRNLMLIGSIVACTLAAPAIAQQATEQEQKNVQTKVETETLPIKPITHYTFDRGVGPGRVKKVGTGEPGEQRITKTTYLVNGKVAKVTTKVEVTKEPSHVKYLMGHAGYNKIGRSGAYSASRTLTMNSTAYIAFEGAMNPTDKTATGRKCEFGIVAVDPKVIPLNTLLFIENYGFGIAADTGGAIKGNKIDLCMDTRAQMNAWGRRNVTVHVLRKLSDSMVKDLMVQPQVTEKIHDEVLASMVTESSANFAAPLKVATPVVPAPAKMVAAVPAIKVEEQNGNQDPASRPGRDAAEPPVSLVPKTTPPPVVEQPKTTPSPETPKPIEPTPVPVGFKRTKVLRDGLNVRQEASTDSPVVAVLEQNDSIMIGAVENGWVPIRTSAGVDGWVRADLLGLERPSQPEVTTPRTTKPKPRPRTNDDDDDDTPRRSTRSTGSSSSTKKSSTTKKPSTSSSSTKKKSSSDSDGSTAYVSKSDVIVRGKSSSDGKAVSMVDKGEQVKIIGDSDGYYKVRMKDGSVGYVRNDMVSKKKPVKKSTSSSSTKTKPKSTSTSSTKSSSTKKKKKTN